MNTTTDIGELLQRRLSSARSLRNEVDGRIRPDVLPDNEELPAISYEVLTSESWDDLIGESGEAQSRIQFDCYGRTRKEANRVAAIVFDIFGGLSGDLEGTQVFDCLRDNRYDRVDPPPKGSKQWRYRRVQDFVVTHTEPKPTLSID